MNRYGSDITVRMEKDLGGDYRLILKVPDLPDIKSSAFSEHDLKNLKDLFSETLEEVYDNLFDYDSTLTPNLDYLCNFIEKIKDFSNYFYSSFFENDIRAFHTQMNSLLERGRENLLYSGYPVGRI